MARSQMPFRVCTRSSSRGSVQVPEERWVSQSWASSKTCPHPPVRRQQWARSSPTHAMPQHDIRSMLSISAEYGDRSTRRSSDTSNCRMSGCYSGSAALGSLWCTGSSLIAWNVSIHYAVAIAPPSLDHAGPATAPTTRYVPLTDPFAHPDMDTCRDGNWPFGTDVDPYRGRRVGSWAAWAVIS